MADENISPAGPGGVEDLDSLAREASGMHQAEADHAQQEVMTAQEAEQRRQQQQILGEAEEMAQILCLVRDVSGQMVEDSDLLPKGRVAEIWTDARVKGLSVPLCQILSRHGGSLGQFMERWGPYAMLAAAACMPTVATIKAVREHKARTVDAAPEGSANA